ncbi:MAG: M48 family metalloprotease [Bdellovibrionaceae bacterium]|nr:M48 family metalloprotease [Pseudobdellovibrionaceae bacterium]
MFKSNAGDKELLGAMVPAKYLGGPGTIVQDAKAARSTFSTVIPNHIKKIIRAASQIRFDENTQLTPYLHNGNLYLIRDDYRVEMGSRTTVGFSLSLNFNREKVLNLDDQFVIGSSVTLGGSRSYIGGESGLNIGQSFNEVFEGFESLLGRDAEKTIDAAIRFTPYINHYLARNFKNFKNQTDSSNPQSLSAIPNSQMLTNRHRQKINLLPREEDYSTELRETRDQLLQNLQNEVTWINKVKPAVTSQLVVDSIQAQQLIQSLCDSLATAYQIPTDIWPRCRIAATWVPNAWAYPGGDIFISAGMIGILSDLDSVLLILGHEIGHSFGRHTTRALPARLAVNAAANGLTLAAHAGVGLFSLTGGAGALGKVSWLSWFPQSVAASALGGKAQELGLNLLFIAPFAALMAHSRSNEWQADRLGHEVATIVGASQEKMHIGWTEFRSFIETFLTDGDSSWIGRIMQSHPDIADREQEIQNRASALEKLHASAGRANKPSPVVYKQYAQLHAFFRPHSIKWGESILADRKQGAETTSINFALDGLINPSSHCAVHALHPHNIDF